MPPTTTTEATAADAVTASTSPDGATPPTAAAAAQTGPMTLERALQVLGTPSATAERDPLDGIAERDPLTPFEDHDPLGGSEVETEAPAEVVTEEAVAEAEAPETEEPAEELPPVKTEADGRKRVNIFRKNPDGSFVYSEISRRALLMADEEGIDVLDALKALGANQLTTTENAKPAEAAAPSTAEPTKTSAQIDAEIVALKASRQKAREEFNDAAAHEAGDQIEDLLRQRSDAVQREVERRESQRHAEAEFSTALTSSEQRATALYPDAAKEGTPLYAALSAEVYRLSKLGSPLLNDPEYPETLAAKVANRLGIAPKVAPEAKAAPITAPKPAAKPAAPVKRATPIPAPGAVSSSPAPVDKVAEISAQIKAAAARNDIKEMNRLMKVATELRAA